MNCKIQKSKQVKKKEKESIKIAYLMIPQYSLKKHLYICSVLPIICANMSKVRVECMTYTLTHCQTNNKYQF